MLLTDLDFPEDINKSPHGAYLGDSENAAWFVIEAKHGHLYLPVKEIRPRQNADKGADLIGPAHAKKADGRKRLEISVSLPPILALQGEGFDIGNLTGTYDKPQTAIAMQADWLTVPYDLESVGSGFFMSTAEATAIFKPDLTFTFQSGLWVTETRPEPCNPAPPASPALTAG